MGGLSTEKYFTRKIKFITRLALVTFITFIVSDGMTFVGARLAKRPSAGFGEEIKLVGSPRSAEAFLGPVAISPDQSTIVVGAPKAYSEAGAAPATAGEVLVYIKSAGTWVLQQVIQSPFPHPADRFGFSVSISGDTLVVGAWGQNFDEAEGNELTTAGAAYVFTRSGGVWSFQKKLVGSGLNGRFVNDYFGYGVSISGNTIAVTAWGQDHDTSGANYLEGAGAVFVFTGSGATWSLQQKIVAPVRQAFNRFGHSLSLDGDTLLVGSYGHSLDSSDANSLSDAGAAYVFVRSGGVWSLFQKITPVDRTAGDNFGHGVSLSGDTLVVGAPFHDLDPKGANGIANAGAAYVYRKSPDGLSWGLQQKLVGSGIFGRNTTDLFGHNVGISGDTIIVGSPLQDYDQSGKNLLSDSGAAYVFTRNSGVWRMQRRLVGFGTNGRRAGDKAGIATAIKGKTLALGSKLQVYDANGLNSLANAGAVYIFQQK